MNFSIHKYAQQGLLGNRNAFRSPFVNQVRCFFLLKVVMTQIMLQTLIYSPRIQILLIIQMELVYMIGSLVKYLAIRHFEKPNSLIHLFGQSTLLIIFLFLVFGMSFQNTSYQNGSTIGEIDRSEWTYGEAVCMIVMTIAVVVEFIVFLVSVVEMVYEILLLILSNLRKNKNTNDPLNPGQQKRNDLKRYKVGIFFKLEEIKEVTPELIGSAMLVQQPVIKTSKNQRSKKKESSNFTDKSEDNKKAKNKIGRASCRERV